MIKPKTHKAPLSGALAQAIARHTAARAATDAFRDDPDGYPEHFGTAEFDALDELAFTPCASDAGFIEKLRYLHAYETRMSGPPDGKDEFGSVALAGDSYFFPVNA